MSTQLRAAVGRTRIRTPAHRPGRSAGRWSPAWPAAGSLAWTPAWTPAWILATAGAVWVALWRLGTPSTVNDELDYRAAAAAMTRGDWTLNNQHPPLAKELIALFGAIGRHAGASPLVADRLLGAACFVVTGLLLGPLARRVGSAGTDGPAGRPAGLLAAVLWWALPLSPGVLVAHVDRYALLEAPMLTAMAAAMVVAAVVAARPADATALPARHTWGAWALLGACIGAATACKLLGVLVAPVALVPFVAARSHPGLRRAVGGLALAAVVSVTVFAAAYAPMGAHAWPAVRTAVTFQLHHASTGHLQTVAGRNYLFPPVWAPLWFQGAYLGPAATVALWAAALLGAATAGVRRRAAGWVPLVALVTASVAVASMSIKLPQYHDTLVGPLDVLAAAGLARAGAVAARSRAATGMRMLAAAGVLVLAAPLSARSGAALAALAHLRPGDYRVAASVLRAHGVTGPVVVWGDAAALAAQGYPVTTTPVLPADCRPVALVMDATSIHRLPGVDAAAWLRRCGAGYERVPIDRVTVYLRPARP